MDPNNVGGMNFVTGGDSVPENLDGIGNAVKPAQEVQNTAAPAQGGATLSSVINEPINAQPQEVPSNVPPVSNSANATLSSVISGPTPEVQNAAPAQEAATLSSVVNGPVQDTQNNAVPVQETVNQSVSPPVETQPQEPQNALPGTPSIGSVTPNAPLPQQATAPNANNPVEDEKQNKLKKILIFVVVLLALTAIGIIVGFIMFDKFGNKGENLEEPTPTVDENIIQANVINNYDVDLQELTDALELLGIRDDANGGNVPALTYYVTDENYRDNAKDIIVYYAVLGSDMTSSFDISEYKSDKGACGDSEGCSVISKEDAEKIIKLYDFSGKLEDYFYKSDASDDVYGIHYGDTLELPQFNGTNLGIGHNLTARYVGDDDIDIEDTQVFNYNDDEGEVKNTNRVVKYTFKKNEDEGYYLDSVLINE